MPLIRRLALVATCALAVALAPASSARAVTMGLPSELTELVDTVKGQVANPTGPKEVADDICVLPAPRSAVCMEIEGKVVPDARYPWRTTVEAHARVCVHDGWWGIFNPAYPGGEVACGYTNEDWGYVGGASGACVAVTGLARPAACVNGQDECVLVVMNANRILCD